MNINMPRAEADAYRAQLLEVTRTGTREESAAAWVSLRDFNAARRVAASQAGFGPRYEQQRQGLVLMGRASTANPA